MWVLVSYPEVLLPEWGISLNNSFCALQKMSNFDYGWLLYILSGVKFDLNKLSN
jgi:hypothetical protein